MGKRSGRALVASVVIVAALAALGGRADAAGPPTFTGGQEVVAPYTGNLNSAMASNGQRVLVVWESSEGSDIWGRFVAPDTTSMADPFRISQRALDESDADVAWNGSSFLVVWRQEVAGGSSDIRGQRIAGDGDFEGGEIAISNGPSSQTSPAVAAGANGQFLVTWADLRNASTQQSDLYGGRVTATGGTPDGIGTRFSTDTPAARTSEFNGDLAWNGSVYLAVFFVSAAPSRIGKVAVRPNGTSAHAGSVASGRVGGASVASDGDDFFVVLGRQSSDALESSDIVGHLVDGSTFEVSARKVVSAAPGEQGNPAIAWNGSYVVVWSDRRNGGSDLWGTQVDRQGQVQIADGFLVTEFYPVNFAPAVEPASGAGTFTVSWTAVPSGLGDGIVAYGMQFAPK